jgi:antitoxin HicB
MAATTNVKEQIQRIAALPYRRELVQNEDGSWFARIAEFSGCMTEGDTRKEALANLDDAMNLWLTAKFEDGDPIPDPMTIDSFSGKFMVRIPKSMHRELAAHADADGSSLNQYVTALLARGLEAHK